MATIGGEPLPTTPAVARGALDRDLPRVLKGLSLEEMGWKRPDDLTLLVPMKALGDRGTTDEFLLRLGFGYYPDWPPSALFVNPATARYEYPVDVSHLPQVDGTDELRVHASYNSNGQYNVTQLICASVTLEFYLVRHSVNRPEHLWSHPRQNFAATINGISHWLKVPYYKGRQKI